MMKKVLITGGTRGIGLAIVKRFLKVDDEIIVVARNFDNIDPEIKSNIRCISCDLTDEEELEKLVQVVGDIDILVNNAGMFPGENYKNYDKKIREKIIKLNIITPIDLITLFSEKMIKNGGGRIVNVASHASIAGNPDIWYGMTKAALVNATHSFAGLLGEKGIVINSVSPGPVQTNMLSESPYEERFKRMKARTYSKRFARPDEIADVVYWLAKESPEYLNGENIVVNSGAISLEME